MDAHVAAGQGLPREEVDMDVPELDAGATYPAHAHLNRPWALGSADSLQLPDLACSLLSREEKLGEGLGPREHQ